MNEDDYGCKLNEQPQKRLPAISLSGEPLLIFGRTVMRSKLTSAVKIFVPLSSFFSAVSTSVNQCQKFLVSWGLGGEFLSSLFSPVHLLDCSTFSHSALYAVR